MDFFDAVVKRHSYRGEFEDRLVPREDLERIVDAGIRAPSGCNAQTTSFVIVDDPEKLNAIASLVEDRVYLRTAKAMILCVAEHKAVYGDMSFGVEDCAASVENMLLAITAMGYASVWLDGMLRKDGLASRIGAILGVPEALDVRVLLPIGVPKESCEQRGRKSFPERAWYNGWGL